MPAKQNKAHSVTDQLSFQNSPDNQFNAYPEINWQDWSSELASSVKIHNELHDKINSGQVAIIKYALRDFSVPDTMKMLLAYAEIPYLDKWQHFVVKVLDPVSYQLSYGYGAHRGLWMIKMSIILDG